VFAAETPQPWGWRGARAPWGAARGRGCPTNGQRGLCRAAWGSQLPNLSEERANPPTQKRTFIVAALEIIKLQPEIRRAL